MPQHYLKPPYTSSGLTMTASPGRVHAQLRNACAHVIRHSRPRIDILQLLLCCFTRITRKHPISHRIQPSGVRTHSINRNRGRLHWVCIGFRARSSFGLGKSKHSSQSVTHFLLLAHRRRGTLGLFGGASRRSREDSFGAFLRSFTTACVTR